MNRYLVVMAVEASRGYAVHLATRRRGDAAAAGRGCFPQKKIVPLPSGPAPAEVAKTELEKQDGPKCSPGRRNRPTDALRGRGTLAMRSLSAAGNDGLHLSHLQSTITVVTGVRPRKVRREHRGLLGGASR